MSADRGRTLADAIRIAMEILPGPVAHWARSRGAEHKAMRAHVVDWIKGYAHVRGVILDAIVDIEPELDRVLDELRRGS